MPHSLITFSLGPVQTFIESARSVRDLWMGSYLLSWLTYQAMQPIVRKHRDWSDPLIFPSIKQYPLWTSDDTRGSDLARVTPDELPNLLSPCLPNRFLAEVPLGETEARQLAAECSEACRTEWDEICGKTYHAIVSAMPTDDMRGRFSRATWDAQTQSFFEIQTVVSPLVSHDDATLLKWLGELVRDPDAKKEEWLQSWRLMQSLFAASRAVRHVPDYGLVDRQKVAAKCSILGSYEQMGPAGLKESKDFWQKFCGDSGEPVRVNSARMRSGERFCAISMVKRFAFAAALVQRVRRRTTADTVDIWAAVRYPDTHTVAAAKWLERSELTGDFALITGSEKSDWNGQWLHWERPNQDERDVCPDDVWGEIQRKKNLPDKGPPPIYYAVLMLDGDKIGDRLRVASQSDQAQMSGLMSEFALQTARACVEKHHGVLIYSGGDDVLALLPVETALECASELQTEFSSLWSSKGYQDVTASAGLSLVHAKEDLRLALASARSAEKLAKKSGRNCLALKTSRGSGEYSTAVLPWNFVSTIDRWVQNFIKQASDRWTYRLASEMTTWSEFAELKILKNELNRQLRRSDQETQDAFLTGSHMLEEDLQSYHNGLLERWETKKRQTPESPGDEPSAGKSFERFITLVQSASSIARGRDR